MWIALISRGVCTFEDKVLFAQAAGAVAVIVYNNVATLGNTLVTMSPSTDGGAAVTIPSVFVTKEAGTQFAQLVASQGSSPGVPVMITADLGDGGSDPDSRWAIIVFIGILAILVSSFFIMIFLIIEIYRQRRRTQRRRPKPIPHQIVITIPTREVVQEDIGEDKNCTCAICLDDFEAGGQVRHLPCNHEFHLGCIDPWLMNHNRLCPVCKMDIERGIELRRLEADGRLGELIELEELNNRPSSSSATYSQRDSNVEAGIEGEEGAHRTSIAVAPSFTAIAEETAQAPEDGQGDTVIQVVDEPSTSRAAEESAAAVIVPEMSNDGEDQPPLRPARSNSNLISRSESSSSGRKKPRGLFSFFSRGKPRDTPQDPEGDHGPDQDHEETV